MNWQAMQNFGAAWRRARGRLCMVIVIISLFVVIIGACSDGPTVTAWVQPSDLRLAVGNRITIFFSLSENARVSLSIHDQGGKLVRSLIHNEEQTGIVTDMIMWDGRNNTGNVVRTGSYYVLLSTGSRRSIIPITVLQ